MINKRLLIKNLLAHSDENSFYDRKRFINLSDREGKAKFLKIVCALANSNPYNNAFIIVGVEDESRLIFGVDFFDDSHIQNLVNSYLENPPSVMYENIIFPDIAENKVVGLVTVRSSQKICSLSKGVWKYPKGTIFKREGSNSKIVDKTFKISDVNLKTVRQIEKLSSNNIQHTLDATIHFLNHRHKDLQAFYHVFREQFVLCYAGKPERVDGKLFYSRVDIELINEQVQLFFSALDLVEIHIQANSFQITEYIELATDFSQKYHPLETLTIEFFNNGTYKIHQKLVFIPPAYNLEKSALLWDEYMPIVKNIIEGNDLNNSSLNKLKLLPSTFLTCYLSGYIQAKELLEEARFKYREIDRESYPALKRTLRIMRKLKYNTHR
ncbi:MULTISPECIES: DUF5929 domain-containing protein [Capnocytophaga]|uniref:Uncharacterized protein n=1 Tax=Capnocytophaga canis TaxID=1848903 RepID=A0A0B7IR66_9FLAO|nr:MULTISPECIES: DUF5929 domain-containing protein [Capnocytophaga]ATA75625.1 ATP-binding protein [Capnocytophaga sp. H2931]CEN54396.1 conserved hypothetical protein [Capnocytophaga canis]